MEVIRAGLKGRGARRCRMHWKCAFGKVQVSCCSECTWLRKEARRFPISPSPGLWLIFWLRFHSGRACLAPDLLKLHEGQGPRGSAGRAQPR